MPHSEYGVLLNSGAWQTVQGTPLSTAVTATISQQLGGADFGVPLSQWYAGAVFRVTAHGFLTTTATSTTATIFLAAAAAPTTLATAPGITTSTTALTGIPWRWETISRVTAVASSGNTVSTQGWLWLGVVAGATPALIASPVSIAVAADTGINLPVPVSNGETAAAVNNTAATTAIMLRGTLAGANATVNCQQFLIEQLD